MKSETSFRVFFLKQHRKNSLKNIFFPSESVFFDFSFWPQGHRSSQNAHCAVQCVYGRHFPKSQLLRRWFTWTGLFAARLAASPAAFKSLRSSLSSIMAMSSSSLCSFSFIFYPYSRTMASSLFSWHCHHHCHDQDCNQSHQVSSPPGSVIGTVEQQWSILYPR